jgi:hypothetical protein
MPSYTYGLIDSSANLSKAVCSASGQYMMGFKNNSQSMSYSSDYGVTWSTGPIIDGSGTIANIVCDDAGLNIAVTISNGNNSMPFYVTTDGVSFFSRTSRRPVNGYALTCDSLGLNLLIGDFFDGSSNKLYHSTNGGNTMTNCIGPPGTTRWGGCLISSANGQHIYAIGTDVHINSNDTTVGWYSSDYGVHFTPKFDSSSNPWVNNIQTIVCDSTGQYLVTTDGTIVYRSSDYGSTWVDKHAPSNDNQSYQSLNHNLYPCISCDATGQTIAIADSNQFRTYLSTNGGTTWSLQTTPGSAAGYTISVLVSGDGSNLFTIVRGVGIYRYPAPVACFLKDTKILCKIRDREEYIPIQHLMKGILIKTSNGEYMPIDIVGCRIIHNPALKERIDSQLYVCSKDKYPGLTDDLIITGGHCILVDDFKDDEQRNQVKKRYGDIYVTGNKYRLPAHIDDRTEIYEKAGTAAVYHISLTSSNDDLNYGIYANGLLVESCFKQFIKDMMTENRITQSTYSYWLDHEFTSNSHTQ